jgi:hypothetical protein
MVTKEKTFENGLVSNHLKIGLDMIMGLDFITEYHALSSCCLLFLFDKSCCLLFFFNGKSIIKTKSLHKMDKDL